jgi:hypothetical protein
MNPNVRFTKTEKGQEEIRNRTHRLNPRLRQVLVLVDGSKPIGELVAAAASLGGDATVLELLVRDGFIAPIDGPAAASAPVRPSAPPAAPSAAPAAAARPAAAPAPDDPAKVSAAKMAMRSYIKLAAGMLEARALNKLVDGVHSTDEALRCFAALRQRMAGGDRAEALANLDAELAAILGR